MAGKLVPVAISGLIELGSQIDGGGAWAIGGTVLGAFITQWPQLRQNRAERKREVEAARDKDLEVASSLSGEVRDLVEKCISRIEDAGTDFGRLALDEEARGSIPWNKPGARVPSALVPYHDSFGRKLDRCFATALAKLKTPTVRESTQRFQHRLARVQLEITPKRFLSTDDTDAYLKKVRLTLINDVGILLAICDRIVQRELIENPQLNWIDKMKRFFRERKREKQIDRVANEN